MPVPKPITNDTCEQWSAQSADDGTVYTHTHLPIIVYECYAHYSSTTQSIDGYYCPNGIPSTISSHSDIMNAGSEHMCGTVYRTDGRPNDQDRYQQQYTAIATYLQRFH